MPLSFKLIVKPGHKAATVLNNDLIVLTSTVVFLKNSSLGCQVTTVPVGTLFVTFDVVLFSNNPSTNLICSCCPSLQVHTSNQ